MNDEKYAYKSDLGFHAARPRPVNPKTLEQRGEKDAREILVKRFQDLRRPGNPAIMTIKELSAEVGLEFKGGVLIDTAGELAPIELG